MIVRADGKVHSAHLAGRALARAAPRAGWIGPDAVIVCQLRQRGGAIDASEHARAL